MKVGQWRIMFRSSEMVTLEHGLHSKMRRRMESNSSVNGRIDFKNSESWRKALKVESS